MTTTTRARIPRSSLPLLGRPSEAHRSRNRQYRKPLQPLFVGELGNDSGRVEDSTQNHLKFVREVQGVNSDGNQRYGEPILVRSSTMGSHLVGYGTRVKVGYDFDGELAILGADYKSMVQLGNNPAVLNSADPRTKTQDTNNWPQLLCYAVADADTATLSVAVKPFVYRDYLGEFRVYNGGQVDLTSYVPSTTGNHALVVLFLDQRDNTIVVHSSTEKAQTQTLTHAVDLAEVYDAASLFAIPIKGWRLIEGQTTILGSTLWDLRPFINLAQTPGFPNPVTRGTVIPAGVTENVHGTLTVTGTLTISGTLTIVDDNPPVINKTAVTVTGLSTLNDVVFDSTGGLAFGEIYASDVNDTITIAASGQANKVQITSFAANGLSNNMTPDHTNDHITVTHAGVYMCTISLSAKSGAGVTFISGFSLYKNNGATEFQNVHANRRLLGGGGDTGSISLSGLVDLAAGDTVELWVWNETNTVDIIIDDATLTLVMVGGT